MKTIKILALALAQVLAVAPAFAAWTYVGPQTENLRLVAVFHTGNDARDRALCAGVKNGGSGSCQQSVPRLDQKRSVTLFSRDNSSLANFWAIGDLDDGLRGGPAYDRRVAAQLCRRVAGQLSEPGAFCK